jgi:hypothetical protein
MVPALGPYLESMGVRIRILRYSVHIVMLKLYLLKLISRLLVRRSGFVVSVLAIQVAYFLRIRTSYSVTSDFIPS